MHSLEMHALASNQRSTDLQINTIKYKRSTALQINTIKYTTHHLHYLLELLDNADYRNNYAKS